MITLGEKPPQTWTLAGERLASSQEWPCSRARAPATHASHHRRDSMQPVHQLAVASLCNKEASASASYHSGCLRDLRGPARLQAIPSVCRTQLHTRPLKVIDWRMVIPSIYQSTLVGACMGTTWPACTPQTVADWPLGHLMAVDHLCNSTASVCLIFLFKPAFSFIFPHVFLSSLHSPKTWGSWVRSREIGSLKLFYHKNHQGYFSILLRYDLKKLHGFWEGISSIFLYILRESTDKLITNVKFGTCIKS